MTTKFTETITVKIEPALKAALENLLNLTPRTECATMGDLLRDMIGCEVQKRMKKRLNKKEDKNEDIES